MRIDQCSLVSTLLPAIVTRICIAAGKDLQLLRIALPHHSRQWVIEPIRLYECLGAALGQL